jgi:phospholipid-transporting ATPase
MYSSQLANEIIILFILLVFGKAKRSLGLAVHFISSFHLSMSDDFLRLVSQANPAATRQYQPANGYPPSAAGLYNDSQASPSNPQLLDPFFDDDDDNAPDSAFGRPGPMHSQESGLPLARSAAPHAGTKPGDGVPQGWDFDDDEFRSGPFAGSVALEPNPSPMLGPTSKLPASKHKWKWPWQKAEAQTGERVVALNSPESNLDFGNNFVSTSKFNFATFLPKFLFGASQCLIPLADLTPFIEQFSKYANLFFLFTACIQQIPDVSPTNPYTTIIPLAAVLLASAFKEVQEDSVSLHPFED